MFDGFDENCRDRAASREPVGVRAEVDSFEESSVRFRRGEPVETNLPVTDRENGIGCEICRRQFLRDWRAPMRGVQSMREVRGRECGDVRTGYEELAG